MLGLISAEYSKRRGRRCRVRVSGARPLGLNAAHAVIEIPGSAGERHIERAVAQCAQVLSSLRVRKLLPRRDLELAHMFWDMGFSPMDCRALLRSKAGEIAARAAPGRERALLSSRFTDGDTLRAFRELEAGFRYIVLDMPESEFRRLAHMTLDSGLAPEPLRRDRTADVDAAVFLSAPRSAVFLPARCVYTAAEGAGGGILGGREIERVTFSLPDRLDGTVPDGFAPAPLLSEALSAGVLSPADIRVTGLQ